MRLGVDLDNTLICYDDVFLFGKKKHSFDVHKTILSIVIVNNVKPLLVSKYRFNNNYAIFFKTIQFNK